jgi:vacuolar protein sorting-associated protein 13A/C
LTESYEEHFVLPDGRVALLTNAGLLLVHAPGFAQLDGAAEIGAIAVSDVAPGQLQWSVRWDDVLAFELRFSREGHYPDRLVVHRKGTPGWQEEESLAHQVKCFEGTPQASQIKLVAEKVLRKYYLDPLRRNRMWSQRHDARAGLPSDTPLEQLPLTMPSLDFVLTWHTNPRKSPVVSFWRPLPPAGYRAVGDVMSLGLEPPSAPVPCFRDDVGLRIGASQRGGIDEPPVAMRPREFALVWRYNGKRPVTVWMPVSPPGYAALGAVVRGEPEVPATEDYLCIRSDLTTTAQTFNSPLWSYDPSAALLAAAAATPGSSRGAPLPLPPHHPETWKVRGHAVR